MLFLIVLRIDHRYLSEYKHEIVSEHVRLWVKDKRSHREASLWMVFCIFSKNVFLSFARKMFFYPLTPQPRGGGPV